MQKLLLNALVAVSTLAPSEGTLNPSFNPSEVAGSPSPSRIDAPLTTSFELARSSADDEDIGRTAAATRVGQLLDERDRLYHRKAALEKRLFAHALEEVPPGLLLRVDDAAAGIERVEELLEHYRIQYGFEIPAPPNPQKDATSGEGASREKSHFPRAANILRSHQRGLASQFASRLGAAPLLHPVRVK